MAEASSECPLCGHNKPHAHDDDEIKSWIEAQASRFGFRAHPYREAALPDDLRWFVEHIYTDGQERGLYDNDHKKIDYWTDELRTWLRHDSPERQVRPSPELLAQIGFLPKQEVGSTESK